MRKCGLASWLVCVNVNTRDIRDRYVTIRSEIWAENISSMGIQDIRKKKGGIITEVDVTNFKVYLLRLTLIVTHPHERIG